MYRVAYDGSMRILLDILFSEGGEAYIYDIGPKKLAKIYKLPDDPTYSKDPVQQERARERIAVHQTKLREFPFSKLPSKVVIPLSLLTDANEKKVLGYSMEKLKGFEPMLKYLDPEFRTRGGIGNNAMLGYFRDLHPTVKQVHEDAGGVISDFNSLNVLLKQGVCRIVDADSMGNSKYLSQLFTANYVDPRLCDPNLKSMMLIRPHDRNSDWYAYMAMLMEALLFVRPYGGVYIAKNKMRKVLLDERPLRGISVFNSAVKYPKDAPQLNILPDELLEIFSRTFEKGWRGEFPLRLLDINFEKCSNCGIEHARAICPNCLKGVASKKVTQIRGSVKIDFLFQTRGVVIYATVQNGTLKYIFHEDGNFIREGGSVALVGDLDPGLRYRVSGKKTILARDGRMVVLEGGKVIDNIPVDSFGNLPLIDANSRHRYWASGGILYRDEDVGPEPIGTVLEGQTMFWVGESFGFGFYRVGNLTRAFTFDADRSGINDSVNITPTRGQLVDSTCVFTSTRAWFMTTEKNGPKLLNRLQVINSLGEIEAVAETDEGDGSWLGNIRGKLPVGNFILSATDEGLVRSEIVSGKVTQTKVFPDTEPYVDKNSFLLPSSSGVLVIRKKEILSLTIK